MYAIVDQGLDDVSMRDIARRAGMSPGHILYYFASKDALLLAVLQWSRRRPGHATPRDAREDPNA